VGHRIKARYEVLDVKHGGLATVYICFDHEFRDLVAIKSVQNSLVHEVDVVARFLREAELWMRLERHRNIVWARWVDNIGGRPCIFMEVVRGDDRRGADLGSWIASGELTLTEAVAFAIQICTGLIYAQRRFAQMGRPFVHRDLKPTNIMVTADQVAKVTDFGLAKVFGDIAGVVPVDPSVVVPDQGDGFATKAGEVFGTPPYMAPEQWISSRDIDIRADIYSLGCVLYHMLARRPPFVCNKPAAYMELHLRKPVPALLTQVPDVPPHVAVITAKCLAKDPGERYQSVEELRNDLSRAYHDLSAEWFVYSDNPETLSIADISNIAMALHELGQSHEALTYFDRLLGQLADDMSPAMLARVFNNRGNCHSSLGEPEKALANYELAKRIDEAYDYPWHNSAAIYIERGDYHTALREVERAVAINPGFADSRVRRADLLHVFGRHREAIEECTTAIALDPANRGAYMRRIACYEALGYRELADADRKAIGRLTGK
jgi:serine/threonine protein kinase